MPISLEQSEMLCDRLEPYPPDRAGYVGIYPRARPGGPVPRVQGAVGSSGGGGTGLPGPISPEPLTPSPPGGVAPPFMAAPPITNLQGFPVSFLGFTSASDVNGMSYGPIAGPCVLKSFRFAPNVALTASDHATVLRIDFAEDSVIDQFPFVSGQHPTMASTAPYSLFEKTVDMGGGGDGSDLSRSGWMDVRPINLGDSMNVLDVNYFIPLDRFFLKIYFSNGSGSTVSYSVLCLMAYAGPRAVEIPLGPLPPIPNPPAVVPMPPLLGAPIAKLPPTPSPVGLVPGGRSTPFGWLSV